MKQKQHIVVHGYPDILKDVIKREKSTIVNIDGVGNVNALAFNRIGPLLDLLDKHSISYSVPSEAVMVRVKYLLGGSIIKSVRGKLHGKDVVYTVEADNDREMFVKMDAAQLELDKMGVEYEKVCKWICEFPPPKPIKKTQNKTKKQSHNNTQGDELKRIASIVEEHQVELSELKGKKPHKIIKEDRSVMAGILD